MYQSEGLELRIFGIVCRMALHETGDERCNCDLSLFWNHLEDDKIKLFTTRKDSKRSFYSALPTKIILPSC